MYGKSFFRTYQEGSKHEWLITNGVGGFASSTIIGANTRRYHGLLVASFNPPVQRHLIMSKFDEVLEVDGKEISLSTNKTDDSISNGYQHLVKFSNKFFPIYEYNYQGISINKIVTMRYGQNTTLVRYVIQSPNRSVKLKVYPLVNFRDYHYDSKNQYMNFKTRVNKNTVEITPYDLETKIKIITNSREFVQHDDYFYNMHYDIEAERGLIASEDHYMPGHYTIEIEADVQKKIDIFITTENSIDIDGDKVLYDEIERKGNLIKQFGQADDEILNRLVISADDFIVYRKSIDAKTIIAGYPWFTDWGRDTMIAFPGITLCTKRYDDAKQILYTFSQYEKDGLIPNMFPDAGSDPIYNTVDASLWYVEAVNKYVTATDDYNFVKEKLYKSLESIIENYTKGTHFNIKMDNDYLITQGELNTQLTWMDAKIGDWVVTPRQGKAVEINALWYNALMVMSKLASKFEIEDKYLKVANKVKASFKKVFWYKDGGYLYDIVNDTYCDAKLRPNQIIALSLSYPVIDGPISKSVVNVVLKNLYTPYGLRSLAQTDSEYKGIYIGNRFDRDSSYHQGTIWAWLMGHFIIGYLRAYDYSKEAKVTCNELLAGLINHLDETCINSVSEIFDGDFPHYPRGCCAQAWSVGELLRAYLEVNI